MYFDGFECSLFKCVGNYSQRVERLLKKDNYSIGGRNFNLDFEFVLAGNFEVIVREWNCCGFRSQLFD